jgi:hypothetical protein
VKKYLLTLALMLAFTVTLEWDESQGATGYLIYARGKHTQAFYDYNDPVWTGSGLTATVTLDYGQYCFVARAFNDAGISDDSNEACTVAKVPVWIFLLLLEDTHEKVSRIQ